MTIFRIRRLRDLNDLRAALDALGSQFDPAIERHDERFRLEPIFEQNRELMLVVEQDGRVVGGALGFRTEIGATVRVIALEPSARGKGLGRRVMQTIESGCERTRGRLSRHLRITGVLTG